MPRINATSQYYADDKDIFDLLFYGVKQGKFTTTKLLHMARRRGVFLSPLDSLEDVARAISLLGFNYEQLDYLLSLTEIRGKDDRVASTKFRTDASLDAMVENINSVKKNLLESQSSQNLSVSRTDGERIVVQLKYFKHDHSKTRLAQKQEHDAEIVIEKSTDGYNIRYKAEDEARELVDKIARNLGISDREKVSLSQLPSAEARSKFFLRMLTDGIDGYEPVSVTAVHLCRMPDTENRSSATARKKMNTSVEKKLRRRANSLLENQGNVKKLALQGEDLLNSDEYKAATKKQLYINRLVWVARPQKGIGYDIAVEADFPETGEHGELRYSIKWVTDTKSSSGEKKRRRSTTTGGRREGLFQLLADGARRALADTLRQVSASLPKSSLKQQSVEQTSISNQKGVTLPLPGMTL